MTINILIQLGFAVILFIFSAGVAWYEGSNLLEDPWEWKYTAVFSEKMNGEVVQPQDILPIDYFLYAAKFFPAFPLAMLFSGTYLTLLAGYLLFRRNPKRFSIFLLGVGVLFLVLRGFLSNSPTVGLKMFFNSFLFTGVLLIVAALMRIVHHKMIKNS